MERVNDFLLIFGGILLGMIILLTWIALRLQGKTPKKETAADILLAVVNWLLLVFGIITIGYFASRGYMEW